MTSLLLEHGANVSLEDDYGRNCLEVAILHHQKYRKKITLQIFQTLPTSCFSRSVVKAILKSQDWRMAMRTTNTVTDLRGESVPDTPMRMLIRVYPDLAETILDRCYSVEDLDDDLLPKFQKVSMIQHSSRTEAIFFFSFQRSLKLEARSALTLSSSMMRSTSRRIVQRRMIHVTSTVT